MAAGSPSFPTRSSTRRIPWMAAGIGQGVADHRLGRISPKIRALKVGHDVIVMIHWGGEYSFYPLPYQMRQARRMIDYGALHPWPRTSSSAGDRAVPRRPNRVQPGKLHLRRAAQFANRSFIYGAEPGRIGAGTAERDLPGSPRAARSSAGDRKLRPGGLIDNLGAAYAQKDRQFWNDISHAYLTDLCGRVIRTRSAKYLFVPPWSFYRDVGLGRIVRKLKPANVLALFR